MRTPFCSAILFLLLLGGILSSCQKQEEETPTTKDILSSLSPSDPNNPKAVIGPLDPIATLPYPEISTNEYVIELERWDIPNNRTDPQKTTDNLQAAIDWAVGEGFGKIRLPAGHYLIGKEGNSIYQAGITLKSNMAFLLDKNAIIEMAPNNKWNYCAISINRQQNVVVSGGIILGDRDRHTYTPRESDGSTVHDEGHLICIEGESQQVWVENMVLAKANGDGILIVGSKRGEPQLLQNVTIKHCNFTDNRRQGVSIVGGSEILIEGNEIHHTKGTSPQFGVDLEGAGRLNEKITIRSNYFHHNRGGDIVNTDGKGVLVEENIMEQGEGSEYLDGPVVYWKNADWTVRKNSITMLSVSANNWNGIIMYSNDRPKTNPTTSYIYENTCNSCGFYMYKGADLVIRDNHLKNGHLAFLEMKNLTVTNNKVEHDNRCWAYRFKEVSGQASGNTYNGEAFDIPLQQDQPWDGCWIR
ncbi:MAG TPA: hypothetical protein DCS93_18475 [Microscillaceae bacterium]|nr:hypothetical protein [Microscillaceae bacterium]